MDRRYVEDIEERQSLVAASILVRRRAPRAVACSTKYFDKSVGRRTESLDRFDDSAAMTVMMPAKRRHGMGLHG
jgi:hypothetical protein